MSEMSVRTISSSSFPPSAAHVRVVRSPWVTVIRLAGEVDAWLVESVWRPALADVEWRGGALVVDLAAVTFLDVVALDLLVELRLRAARAGQDFWLSDPPRRVRRLISVAGLDRMLLPDRTESGPESWRP